jgi:hypothetical protein
VSERCAASELEQTTPNVLVLRRSQLDQIGRVRGDVLV